jgi:intraflagellar transport protein 80
MQAQLLSKTSASALTGVDGMVTSLCCDDKNFYSAVDGGVIRRYPISQDDVTQTTDDIFIVRQSHITAIDSTRDPSSPNFVIIGCSDGNLHVCSPNWRVDKTIQAHTGGVTCVRVNPDGLSIASAGEDGLVKIWGRNGSLRSSLASCGATITSCNWDCTGKYLMFTHGGMVTVRSASFKQDQTQFRAHRRLVTCSDWNKATNEIITGSEDRLARIFDPDGRLLFESLPCDFAVSSIAFIPSAKLCLIGTANRLYLMDNHLRTLSTIPITGACTICASRDQPRALIGGGGTVSLVAAIGKTLVYRDCEVVLESPKKLTVFDLKNGVSEPISFNDTIVDFSLDFNHLIVATATKLQIHKSGSWTGPVIVETKEIARVIVQSARMFAFVSASGTQIIGYDGRTITRISDPRVKWDLLSPDSVALSPSVFVVLSPDGRKHVFAFSASTGQSIAAEPFAHPSEIRCVRTNQAATQAKARFGFVNTNGDLTICRFVAANPRVPPAIEGQKLANFVDDFRWHSTHDAILARSGDKLTVWCAPSAVFFTAELLPILRTELRTIFDAVEIESFDGTHAFVTAKDGSSCVVPVAPFLIMLHEAIETHKNWKVVLQICRTVNEQSLWAVCATAAVQVGEVDAAQEAYAALSLIDRVMFLGKVKKMKSPAARNAMIAILQGRVNEAEEILIQGGCVFRAVKMNVSMGRWDRALAIAKRSGKFVEVVAAYRTKYCKDMKIEEPDPEFVKIGQIDMDAVATIIKREKAQELTG